MNAYDLPLVADLWIITVALLLGLLTVASVVALFVTRSIQRHRPASGNPLDSVNRGDA
jgi:hypothetical protein